MWNITIKYRCYFNNIVSIARRRRMKFKLGIGLLLFGINLSIGSILGNDWFFLAGSLVCLVGLICIIFGDRKDGIK